jgi:para-aminobenzoate synthetase component 1
MEKRVLTEELSLGLSPLETLEKLLSLSHPVLLESTFREREIGRYSLVSAEPFLVVKSKRSEITVQNDVAVKVYSGNPFPFLRGLLREYELKDHNELPFAGGAIGYFAYDLNQHLERLPNWTLDDLLLPDMYFCFYDWGLLFDHFKEKSTLVYLDGRKTASKVKQIKKLFQEKTVVPKFKASSKKVVVKSNFKKRDYLEATKKAKEYIFAGDIFQVNLSQRLEAPLFLHPFLLYQILQRLNPAPFAAYLGFEDLTVVSSSPERFLKVDGQQVETRPIKGTRPRGQNSEEEERFFLELFFSEKDRAENLMIVDLERNDLSKVSEAGSVRVHELFKVERYATVFHLVSIVKSVLRKDMDLIDLLEATFPGGSITGAPKVRAMEIIEELEPTKRSVYTGSLGYLSFNQKMDLNIVIRTFIVKDDTAYFQVGGGIVADSQPEAEYQETLDKAKALIDSIKRCV